MYNPINSPEKQEKLGILVKNLSLSDLSAPRVLDLRHFGAFFMSCVSGLFSVLSSFPIVFPFLGTKQIKSENLIEHPKIGGNRAPRHCTERKVQPAVLGWANGVRLNLIEVKERTDKKIRLKSSDNQRFKYGI